MMSAHLKKSGQKNLGKEFCTTRLACARVGGILGGDLPLVSLYVNFIPSWDSQVSWSLKQVIGPRSTIQRSFAL